MLGLVVCVVLLGFYLVVDAVVAWLLGFGVYAFWFGLGGLVVWLWCVGWCFARGFGGGVSCDFRFYVGLV